MVRSKQSLPYRVDVVGGNPNLELNLCGLCWPGFDARLQHDFRCFVWFHGGVVTRNR